MTQENQQLLLQDLSARLLYKVKVTTTNAAVKFGVISGISIENKISVGTKHADIVFNCTEVKPYLFPLSSMTEKLKNFIRWKLTTPKYDSFDEESLEDLFNNNIQVVNFCYEHHLDINGLIEKGLALDATGLNIY